MKKIIVPLFLSFLLASCGDDTDNSAKSSDAGKTISGVAQLGPFEKGTTISVYELDEDFRQTGFNIESEIKNDQGEFSINLKDFESKYALLKADGYYRSPVNGEKSNEKATLYALADLENDSEININILTHLSHKRAIYLATEKNKPFAKAKKKAEAEVLKSFGIEDDFDEAKDLNIIGNDNQSIALLAMSIMMQSGVDETELKERLTNFATDIEEDGVWDDEETIAQIADWAYKVHSFSAFETIKDNVKKWNSSIVLSVFEKYVNSFWHNHYGLGTCTDDRKNEVRKNELFLSNFEKEYFICRPGGKWKEASEKEIEKFFDFGKDVIDGITRTFQITQHYTSCQVYDGDSWRNGNNSECKYGLGGCTKKREGITKVTSTGKYTCEKQNWVYSYIEQTTDESFFTQPGTIDLDSIGWNDTTDGTIRKGNITDVIYIFDKDSWRVASLPEASLGKCSIENLDSAGIVESRDGQAMIDPLSSVCLYNMELTHRYYNCPSKIYQSGYYKCHYAVYEDSKDTIYGWSPMNLCSLDNYDFKDGKITRWKDGKEGETRWGNTQNDSSSYKKCEQRCYKFTDGEWSSVAITQCMGLGTCNEKFIGTIKEGPVVYSEKKCSSNYDMTYDRCYNILVKVDSVKKRNYVCRGKVGEHLEYSGDGYSFYEYNTKPVTGNWAVATEFDLKTSSLKCTYDGALVSLKSDADNLYVCDKNGFRYATKQEEIIGLGCTYWTSDKTYLLKGLKSYLICDGTSYDDDYIGNNSFAWQLLTYKNEGTMTDPRDNTTYETINIGPKTWMSQNLNYADSATYPSMLGKTACKDGFNVNCQRYGRLYTWSAAIDSVYWASKGKTCGDAETSENKCGLPDVVQGICPKGWHLPTIQEWNDFESWQLSFSKSDYYPRSESLPTAYKDFFFLTSTDSARTFFYSSSFELFQMTYRSEIKETPFETEGTPLFVRCVKDD